MYPHPNQQPQWNTGAPPPPAPSQQAPNISPAPGAQQQQQQQPPPQQQQIQQPQQPQQQWAPQPNGYAPRPNQQQIPPISLPQQQNPTIPTLQPQHPDAYRALPAPNQMYGPPPPYPQAPQMQYAQPQQTPRQRTAIACRYCRRRKIRCSGFEQNEDGRCTNCQRFQQECVFTPVSAQSQAFVPAHTVWRNQQPPPSTQLYGAYGQPLRNDQFAGPSQQAPPPAGQPGQYPPPPQGYVQAGYPQPAVAGPSGAPAGNGKRPNEEPHNATVPPHQPGYVYGDPNAALAGRADSLSGLSENSSERRAERLRNGEIKDMGVQTDPVFFSKDPVP